MRASRARTIRSGVKGCGEAGTIAAPAAIVSAVLDALAPLGVTDIEMPLTPEAVWRAICSGAKCRMHAKREGLDSASYSYRHCERSEAIQERRAPFWIASSLRSSQ